VDLLDCLNFGRNRQMNVDVQ